MTHLLATDPLDDSFLLADESDFPAMPWSLDELDRSADLGSVRSAWAGSADLYD
jgi:hypothetical protein